MNRRSFIERLALGVTTFTILPSAGRVWAASRTPVIESIRFAKCTVPEFDTFFDLLLKMKRDREEAPGYDPNVIEIWTPPGVAPYLREMLIFPPQSSADPLQGSLSHGIIAG